MTSRKHRRVVISRRLISALLCLIPLYACKSKEDVSQRPSAKASAKATTSLADIERRLRIPATTLPARTNSPTWEVPPGISQSKIGKGHPVRVDFYNPGGTGLPLVLLIHGSAGLDGDRAERYQHFGQSLMQAGIVAAVVHYFDAPKPQWVNTLQSSLAAIASAKNVDPTRIGIIGYSQGGTLTLDLVSRGTLVRSIAICSGYLPTNLNHEAILNVPYVFAQSGELDKAAQTVELLRKSRTAADKPIESHIYPGEGHKTTPQQLEVEWQSAKSFMARTLNSGFRSF